MHSERLLELIETVEWMSETLGACLSELGELSPAEIEIKLGVLMKGSKSHQRLGALHQYLDGQPANLRLQMRYELGSLVFGTFWIQGKNGLDNKLFSIKCPDSVAFYLDVPLLRLPQFAPSRELRAAWFILAEKLDIKPEAVLEQALVGHIAKNHGAVEAMIGDASAVFRNREVLSRLAKGGVFWQEARCALSSALERSKT